MPTERPSSEPGGAADAAEQKTPQQRRLSPAAERALAEAAARRTERERNAIAPPKESGGRDGPEPTRYGDWEINGITSDF